MDSSQKERQNLGEILQLSRMMWPLLGYDQPYVYWNASNINKDTKGIKLADMEARIPP
jgi:hypothetical protein